MIEPFEANQIKYNGSERIISYGTSSYGYDVRCADEFKIFTNINTTIVDPKKFDEKSFVQMSASSRRIHLPWQERWSISVSRVMS